MMYTRLLLSIAVIAFFLISAYAEAGDPLNPAQTGESMSMPLSPELIQAALDAGVITESNPLSQPDSQQPSFSARSQPQSDAVNSIDNVNVTGTWSLALEGPVREHMTLYLVENEDVVVGQGEIMRGNETMNATVSGSVSADKVSLIVMPVGVLDLYRINLSLSTLSAGAYTLLMADGTSRSGQVTFSVSSDIFSPASKDADLGSGAHADTYAGATSNGYANAFPDEYAPGGSTASTPVQLGGQGRGGRISTKKTMSMSSGGGSMGSSYSSASSF